MGNLQTRLSRWHSMLPRSLLFNYTSFHLFENEQLKQNIFISSSFCLKTKDDVSSLRLPSEHCLIQATVLLKLVGVAPCSGEVLKCFTEVLGTPVPALQIQGTEERDSTKPSSKGKRIWPR